VSDIAPPLEGMTLRDYLAVLWRWKWLIVLVVVAATGTAYYFSARQTPQYSATASLIYEKPLDVSNPLSAGSNYIDPNQQQLDVQSVGTIVTSPDMTGRVEKLVGPNVINAAEYSVSASAAQPGTNSSYTNVATISVTSSDPQQAARIANAYATAFIAWRKQTQQQQVRQAERVIQSKMNTFLSPASRGSSDYLMLEQRLRDLQILEATVTGDFRLVTPAEPPTEPFAPRPKRAAVLGFGVGLFAAIGLAFLLEQLNTRIRDYRETSELLRMPVIGRIPSLPKRYLGPESLAVVQHPDGRAAEAFRMLRGNLEFVNVDGTSKSILVTSCKQGEGKSLTVANLGAALALAGKRVIVVDGDLRRPQMHKYFSLPNEAGLSTVLSGQTTLADSLQAVALAPETMHGGNGAGPQAPAPTQGMLLVLTSGTLPPNPGELIASKKFGILLEHLRTEADVVLVDSPAIMAVGDAAALAAAVDGLVMLVNIEQVRRPTLREVADVLDPLPCRKLGIIVAREHLGSNESYRYAYYRYQRA
jgi:succinoglycan biosynthesis transport protein ExoP